MSFTALIAAAMTMTLNTSAPLPADGPPVARIGEGVLVGARGDGIESFKGVAYAAPPVGELRWRPPKPAPAWTGPRQATDLGPICIQPPSNGDNGVGPLPMSEDCLTLNVWAPEQRPGPLPVMVWIHGGGYNNGSGTAALYDGASLARRGVVVVTINYRLGRLGFFDHPALAAERPAGEAAGNYGVMDMIAALEWVRDHIGAFGGDPGQVTIFGESAGGVAVSQLMISPRARGLFHRAAIQSGLGRQEGALPGDLDPLSPRSTRARGAAWAEAAGVTPTAGALRAVPPERLLEPAPNFFGGDLILTDGAIVPMDVEAAFAAGLQAPVPLLIGTNSAEFWWMKPSDLTPYGALDDDIPDATRAALVEAYGGQEGYDAHLVSDLVFNEPARRLARLHAAAGRPTFLYRFDVVSLAMPEPHSGATHASERQYVFDNLTASPWATDDMDQRAATLMADYWAAFGRTGDPNGGGRLMWPDLRARVDELIEFGNAGPRVLPVPFAQRLDLIEALYTARSAGD